MFSTTKPWYWSTLILCLLFLYSNKATSQWSFGPEVSRMISYERAASSSISTSVIYPASRVGLMWTNTPKKDFFNKYKFDFGVGIISMPGFRTATNELASDLAFQVPLGIGYNSEHRFEGSTQLIASTKYVPGYLLVTKQFSHSIQYDIGVSFLLKSKNDRRRDKRFDFVFFAMTDIASVDYLDTKYTFNRVGISFRSHFMYRNKSSKNDEG
ncbi:hypothetical protein N9B82_05635 [Saprospiraceae bacterium]|nr:hypothetical protein [Saprospiraceae bacterium]